MAIVVVFVVLMWLLFSVVVFDVAQFIVCHCFGYFKAQLVISIHYVKSDVKCSRYFECCLKVLNVVVVFQFSVSSCSQLKHETVFWKDIKYLFPLFDNLTFGVYLFCLFSVIVCLCLGLSIWFIYLFIRLFVCLFVCLLNFVSLCWVSWP